MSIMSLVLKWFGVVNSAFIFSKLLPIYLMGNNLIIMNIIMMIARRTESGNESVISAAINCSHMRPVSQTLLTLLTLRCLQFFIYYYAACL